MKAGFVTILIVAMVLISSALRISRVNENLARIENLQRISGLVDATVTLSQGAWTCSCLSLPFNTFTNTHTSDAADALNAGKYFYYSGRYDQAISSLKKASEDGPQSPLRDYFLGASYICLENGSEAAKYWYDAQLAWRAFSDVWRCASQGQTTRGETLYNLALTSKPEIKEGWRIGPKPILWTYQAAAVIAQAQGDNQLALHWLELIRDDNPDSAQSYYWLGDFFKRSEDWSIAKSYYQHAISLGPTDNPNIYLDLAEVSFRDKDWQTGANALSTTLRQDSPDSEGQWARSTELITANANRALCSAIRTSFRQVPLNSLSPKAKSYWLMIESACSSYGGT